LAHRGDVEGGGQESGDARQRLGFTTRPDCRVGRELALEVGDLLSEPGDLSRQRAPDDEPLKLPG